MAANDRVEMETNDDESVSVDTITELPWNYLNAFFYFVKQKHDNNSNNVKTIIVLCKLCKPKTSYLSTTISSSGNLRKHIQVR